LRFDGLIRASVHFKWKNSSVQTHYQSIDSVEFRIHRVIFLHHTQELEEDSEAAEA
jgi:hypothetical protein